MGKHFYIGDDTKPSYCGKTPAMDFKPEIIEDGYYCNNCMEEFEHRALGAIGEVLGKMSEEGILTREETE